MKNLRSRFGVVTGDESGMSLIEVIVAISIMAIVATAAVTLSITSMASAASQQRGEIAITIANQAMESVGAQSPAVNPSTGVSFLYERRRQAEVEASFSANAAVTGVASTYPRWQPGASGPPAVIPITSAPQRLSGTDYVTQILIGSCYQPSAGGSCQRLPGVSVPPLTAPSGYSELMRVIVRVTWTAGQGCGVGPGSSLCAYQSTSLIDPHVDLEWKTN